MSTQTGRPPHCWIEALPVEQEQVPPEHAPAPHSRPQAPQFDASLARSTQVPHQVCPGGQERDSCPPSEGGDGKQPELPIARAPHATIDRHHA
ncbi:MAG TPA: hypothetical protein VLU43_03295 [Anaeromyxobacteraceae bacterium]|nr:hypothetical protein [Anaeromyxobacteraceae bacterium]